MSEAMKRMVLDVLLTAMLVFEMFYQLTGNALHEYVGFAFFICILVHLFISRKWIYSTVESLGAKELNFRRKVLAFIVFVLAVDMVLLGASSVIISNTFWNMGLDFSAFNPGDIWVPIHTATSYGLCVVVAVHLASHWSFLAKNLHIEYNPQRRRAIGQAVNVVAGVGALALGVTGFSQVTQAIANEQLAERELENTVQQSPETQVEYSGRGKHTRGNRKTNSNANAEQNTDQNTAQNTSQNTNRNTAESTSNDSGICTLCRKRCNFSNLRCDRPYAEGLV